MNFIDGLTLFSVISLACSGFVDLVHNEGYSVCVIMFLATLWFCVGFAYFLLLL